MININEQVKRTMDEKKSELLSRESGTYVEYPNVELLVLHESEFLSYTVSILSQEEFDIDFLSLVTGVNEEVFRVIQQREQDDFRNFEDTLSIVKATIGIIPFAKLALDYYGIERFTTLDGQPESKHDLGEGFFQFIIC